MASLHARLKISIQHHGKGNRRSYQLTKRGTAAVVDLPPDLAETVEDENGIRFIVYISKVR